MKRTKLVTMILLAVCAVIAAGFWNHARVTPAMAATLNDDYVETFESRIGNLVYDHDLPSRETAQLLFDEMDFQRATQSVFWVEAAYNLYLWEKAMDRAGVENLGAMLYDQLAQAGQEVLTPNQSVVYMFDNIHLEEVGPVVYEVPPGPINAGFYDEWYRAFYDFGMVGPNKAKGDKMLIVPPGWAGASALLQQIKTFPVDTSWCPAGTSPSQPGGTISILSPFARFGPTIPKS